MTRRSQSWPQGFGGVPLDSCTRQQPHESNSQTLGRWLEELGYMLNMPGYSIDDLMEGKMKRRRRVRAGE